MRRNDRAILLTVLATGISSVVAQLITIREFLADFEGNEFVIALVLLIWLVSSGIGSFIAATVKTKAYYASILTLSLITACLAVMPTLQILSMRVLKDIIFVQGSSVGFSPTLAFAGMVVAPYALLIGFVLPYSLFILRSTDRKYPASWIYALDSLGAAIGGAAFSFALVTLLTPFKALLAVNTLLIALVCLLLAFIGMRVVYILGLALVVISVNCAGAALELATLKPRGGELVSYQETFFGRIMLIRDRELSTIFIDGMPALSGQNQITAEEASHYALAQRSPIKRVLLVSSETGIMDEIKKYSPEEIDYAQLDPRLISMEFKIGLITHMKGLRIIQDDARAYLKRTLNTYDAILVNYPEPKTFQTNRYFTEGFMRLAKARLNSGGVLSFSVEGYESYLSSPARLRVSSLNNTARLVFAHTLILPGRKIYFIASDAPLSSDIPGLLTREGIKTDYLANYFAGDVSQGRIEALMRLLDPRVPVNTDFRPFLMRLAYEHWFAKYSSYPFGFFAVLGAFFVLYITRLRLEEFVLFTTGCINMGSEILTIFLFQILFGFLYVKIGLIVTVYLAGLIPGVIFGQRLKTDIRRVLFHTDCLMALLLLILLSLLFLSPQGLGEAFFYAFAFLISMLCGIQFPLVAGAAGGGNTASARAFSVDLVGAALGNVLLSALLIPFGGIIASCATLITFKLASIIIQISHGNAHQEDILTF